MEGNRPELGPTRVDGANMVTVASVASFGVGLISSFPRSGRKGRQREAKGGRTTGAGRRGRACLWLNSGDCRNSSQFLQSSPICSLSLPSGLNICAFLFITADSSLPARYLSHPISLSSPPFAFHRLITNCTCSLTPKSNDSGPKRRNSFSPSLRPFPPPRHPMLNSNRY